jgi:hypothetical protein
VRSDRGVTIALTDEQITEVIRDAAAVRGVGGALSGLGDVEELHRVTTALANDPRCSSTALRSLLVLAAFPDDGSDLELSEVAARVHLSPSTTHRYVNAFRAVGLLTQDPITRRYRRSFVAIGRGESGDGSRSAA